MDWLNEDAAAVAEAGVPPDIDRPGHRAAPATGRPCRDQKALVARRARALPQRIDLRLERAGQVPQVVPVRPTTVRPAISVPAHRVKHAPVSRPIDLKSRAGARKRARVVGRIRAVGRVQVNSTTSWATNPARGPVASRGLGITPVWPRARGPEPMFGQEPTIVARMLASKTGRK
jgi:hypothetical protein